MWLRINTDTEKHRQELADFLRSVEYVKSIEVEDSTTPLTDDDWAMPGRPATDKEIEDLAEKMDDEEGGMEAKDFFSNLKNKLAG